MADFQIGDIVSISSDAVYYDGRQITPIIKSKRWVIHSISGNRVVLGTSEYNLFAPVDAKYLSK